MLTKYSCPRAKALLLRVGVLAFYLLLWEAAARLIAQPLLLPDPVSVAKKLLELLPQAMFYKTLAGTLLRTLAAYLLGIAAAVLLGALCVRVRAADLLLSPLLSAIRATPVTSFIVLALVWLASPRVPILTGFLMTLPVVYSALLSAIRATPVTSFIVLALVWLSSPRVPVLTGFLMTLPVVYSALVQAIRAIDPKLLEMARLYGFGRAKTLVHVIIPAVLPAFVHSCLAAIGLCWIAMPCGRFTV